MIDEHLFSKLVQAAALAPSADNMQAWEFRKGQDEILVYYARQRALPADSLDMFGWIGIGAAIQNMAEEALANGFAAEVEYHSGLKDDLAASVRLFPAGNTENLADYLSLRTTNRVPFCDEPLYAEAIRSLENAAKDFSTRLFWTQDPENYSKIADMDANSSYIRLEYKPFHDELFDILRFTKKDIETHRYGLTFESLEVPRFVVFFARQLQYWSVNRLVSQLGFGRLVARQLSQKIKHSGAILLLSVSEPTRQKYIEAGRAVEKIWLEATKMGCSVQPYGVLPQYFTKVDFEPETLLPAYVDKLSRQRRIFNSVFQEADNTFPALVLRIGTTRRQSVRNNIRLSPDQLIV